MRWGWHTGGGAYHLPKRPVCQSSSVLPISSFFLCFIIFASGLSGGLSLCLPWTLCPLPNNPAGSKFAASLCNSWTCTGHSVNPQQIKKTNGFSVRCALPTYAQPRAATSDYKTASGNLKAKPWSQVIAYFAFEFNNESDLDTRQHLTLLMF